MTGMVAAALRAGEMVFLTDTPGLLRDPLDASTLVPRLQAEQLTALPFARGRMRHKLLGAHEAVRGGVRRVVIASGARARPLYAALAGEGTVIEGVSLARTDIAAREDIEEMPWR
jgi:acetylglutamate/LysW-gamma-L-alpha-aminoadipate kinase